MSDNNKNDDKKFGDLTWWELVKKSITPLKSNNFPCNKQNESENDSDKLASNSKTRTTTLKPEFVTKNSYLNSEKQIISSDIINLDKSIAKKVAIGKNIIDARLDLHGNTLNLAAPLVYDFIERNFKRNQRNLLIVTGKGSGALQRETPRWLSSNKINKYILMFCKAQPKDGGEGALYVYLKKNKRKS